MEAFLLEYHLFGIFVGICAFLLIGLFHPVVIKCEYYTGTKLWWTFLLLGIAGLVASILVEIYYKSLLTSSLIGVFSFSSFWCIKELFDQVKRVEKGWFPKNPKRKY